MGIISGITSLPSNNSDLPQKKSFKDQKRWISNLFYQGLNKYVTSEEGDQITNAQAMVEGTIDMAVNKENDPYLRLAAVKFITEHLEGKAATMTEDKHEEMPKLVICVQGTSPDELKHISEQFEDAEPKEDVVVEISNEDGSDQETYLV